MPQALPLTAPPLTPPPLTTPLSFLPPQLNHADLRRAMVRLLPPPPPLRSRMPWRRLCTLSPTFISTATKTNSRLSAAAPQGQGEAPGDLHREEGTLTPHGTGPRKTTSLRLSRRRRWRSDRGVGEWGRVGWTVVGWRKEGEIGVTVEAVVAQEVGKERYVDSLLKTDKYAEEVKRGGRRLRQKIVDLGLWQVPQLKLMNT
mmetsp:Transcript_49688/g.97182  ORF Transcript_49688/g.97182 Transcript_49688/m.97182 type:complete len:201 (-) Transcript_49688:2882-3484(-)